MDRLRTSCVERNWNDNPLPVDRDHQVWMRVIEESSDAVVKVGWKRNLVWPRSGNKEEGDNDDCDQDRHDYYRRKGSLPPLALDLFEYLLFSGLSQAYLTVFSNNLLPNRGFSIFGYVSLESGEEPSQQDPIGKVGDQSD